MVLDSLNMLPVWVRLNRIAIADAANERQRREKSDERAGAEAAKALMEAKRADDAERAYRGAEIRATECELRISGRFWLGFGIGAGATGVGLAALAIWGR